MSSDKVGNYSVRERRLPQRVHDREAMLASLDELASRQARPARGLEYRRAGFWSYQPGA